MPGQNLQKLSKEELKELRGIVRKLYFQDMPEAAKKHLLTNRECDKLIDSLLPETIEKCREQGMAKNFIKKKKFFFQSKILAANGKAILKDG